MERTFRKHMHMKLVVVDAADRFLAALAGVTEPEQKRRRIGSTFIEVFADAVRQDRLGCPLPRARGPSIRT